MVLVVTSMLGCTVPNPRSCADGRCTDPSFPFCDVDGALSGTPQTCLDVACTPDEHVSCRGDVAIRCNPTGNDYDLIDCTDGCSDQGCVIPVACTTNDQCVNPVPICEPTMMSCRGCRTDDECTSKVCDLDSGACLAEAAVIYASATGSGTADCTQLAPCTIARAVSFAAVGGLSKTLRLLPGIYGESLTVTGTVAMKIVATGASIVANNSKLVVNGGATVEIRGLTVDPSGNARALECGLANSVRTTLTMRDMKLDGRSNLSQQSVFSTQCTIRVERFENIGKFSASDGTILEMDRLLQRTGFVQGQLSMTGAPAISIRITNSLFLDGYLSQSSSEAKLAFNTFIFTSSNNAAGCDTSTTALMTTYENNIFFAFPSTQLPFAVVPGSCRFANNLMFPQATPVPGNMVADPQFVDPAMDYHLKTTSPALNTAVPSTGLSTSHDYDGAARPQGVAHDIGAFERTP